MGSTRNISLDLARGFSLSGASDSLKTPYLTWESRIITAHSNNEYVLKSDLVDAVTGYKKLIKESLWPTKRVPSIIEEEIIVVEEVVAPVSSSATVLDDGETEAAKPESLEPQDFVGFEEL